MRDASGDEARKKDWRHRWCFLRSALRFRAKVLVQHAGKSEADPVWDVKAKPAQGLAG